MTISDATRSMAAYTQLTDSILTLIKLSVKDKLVSDKNSNIINNNK